MTTHLTDKLIAVEVRSDADTKISSLNYFCVHTSGSLFWSAKFKLDGNWKILGE